MRMRDVLTILGASLLLIGHVWADDEKYCKSPADQATAIGCQNAKKIGVPLMKFMTASFLSSIEATAHHCAFLLTQQYADAKKENVCRRRAGESIRVFPSIINGGTARINPNRPEGILRALIRSYGAQQYG